MENQIKQIMASTFGVPLHKLKGDFNENTIDNWDSLTHLSLIVELESAFEVSFSPEEIQDSKSFNKIVNILNSKTNQKQI